MIGFVVDTVDTVFHRAAGNIDLTTNDGFDTCCLCCLIKVYAAVHNAVIGDSDGILSQFLDSLHHAVDAAGTVKEAVFCMNMKMYKAHNYASCAICINFFRR